MADFTKFDTAVAHYRDFYNAYCYASGIAREFLKTKCEEVGKVIFQEAAKALEKLGPNVDHFNKTRDRFDACVQELFKKNYFVDLDLIDDLEINLGMLCARVTSDQHLSIRSLAMSVTASNGEMGDEYMKIAKNIKRKVAALQKTGE